MEDAMEDIVEDAMESRPLLVIYCDLNTCVGQVGDVDLT